MIRASSGGFSAVVTWPVAPTKARNCAFVTGVSSIQKPSTRTRCAGRSSSRDLGESLPMENSPAGIQTMPGGASRGRAPTSGMGFPGSARSNRTLLIVPLNLKGGV